MISANLLVPQTPRDTGAVNFYFNALEPNNDSNSPILQPVLQFGNNTAAPGGTYWNMSAYRVYFSGPYNGTVNYTSTVPVNIGDVLTFQVYLNSVGSAFTYYVVPYDNNLNIHNTGSFAQTAAIGGPGFQLYFPAVHESYGDNSCENGVYFHNIAQEANVNTASINRVYVAPNASQFVCDLGTSPSCFFCPQISTNGTGTWVY